MFDGLSRADASLYSQERARKLASSTPASGASPSCARRGTAREHYYIETPSPRPLMKERNLNISIEDRLLKGRNEPHAESSLDSESDTVSCVAYSWATRPMNAIIAKRPCWSSRVAIAAKPAVSFGARRSGSKPMSPG